MYQHFQNHEKVHTLDEQINTQDNDTTLYPYINNDIEYGIFEDIERDLLLSISLSILYLSLGQLRRTTRD